MVSIHAFRGEGDSADSVFIRFSAVSIHAFRGEGDSTRINNFQSRSSFNPRLPGGRRPYRDRQQTQHHCFNPRLPGGRRRGCSSMCGWNRTFQSTPSGGKATTAPTPMWSERRSFNPRLPGGRRPLAKKTHSAHPLFQSTPSGGKATGRGPLASRDEGVSIHAFRGEGDSADAPQRTRYRVSIHAFRGEGDFASASRVVFAYRFNPRLPGGRRHVRIAVGCAARSFNPRLPGGRRHRGVADPHLVRRFNPRLPGGRRPGGRRSTLRMVSFQSTPSGGKATWVYDERGVWEYVSIHAFRGEGDQLARIQGVLAARFQSTPSGGKATLLVLITGICILCFNPRLPGGRRLPARVADFASRAVSIHAFRGEGDAIQFYPYDSPVLVSIHAFRGEGDHHRLHRHLHHRRFQSTPSGGKATATPCKTQIQ